LFRRVIDEEPYRMEGQEYYSVILWHTQRKLQLASLAHRTSAYLDKSPEAWCILGNCYSLDGNRVKALKCFERAARIDPSFTYAYSLSGHEYFTEKDFVRAQIWYQRALKLDPRHYNAW
jgi:anaphase-promoting complex subunit 3